MLKSREKKSFNVLADLHDYCDKFLLLFTPKKLKKAY